MPANLSILSRHFAFTLMTGVLDPYSLPELLARFNPNPQLEAALYKIAIAMLTPGRRPGYINAIRPEVAILLRAKGK